MEKYPKLDGFRILRTDLQIAAEIWSALGEKLKIIPHVSQSSNGVIIGFKRITGISLHGKKQVAKCAELLEKLEQLSQVSLIDCSLRTIPIFPQHIEFFDFSDNQLNNFDGSYYQKLLSLKCRKNLIKLLNVIENRKLKLLDCQFNLLEKVPKLPGQLKRINFAGNLITELPEQISTLDCLEFAHFGKNKIESIPDSFKKLLSIKILNFENNRIQNLPSLPDTLEKLILANNPLKESLPSIKVKHLNLSRTELTKFPEDILCDRLEELFISGNYIRFLPEEVCDIPLRRLVLENNPIFN